MVSPCQVKKYVGRGNMLNTRPRRELDENNAVHLHLEEQVADEMASEEGAPTKALICRNDEVEDGDKKMMIDGDVHQAPSIPRRALYIPGSAGNIASRRLTISPHCGTECSSGVILLWADTG